MNLTKEAQEARKEYQRRWKEKNKEHYSQYMKEWRKNNPEKVKQYAANHWEKKAKEFQED